MATITAVKSGNWSDTTVWDLGRAPADGDLVLAQSYTITFDVDVNQPNTVLNATSGNFRHSGAGTRNVTANANVGNHAVSGLIQNTSTGTLNFYGAIVGGSGNSAWGAVNVGAGTITITTCTGGTGSSAYGAYNSAAGTLRVQLAVGNDYGPGGTHAYANPGVAANNSAGQITSVKSIRYGPHGQSPTAGPVQIVADAALNQATFVTDYSGGTLTLVDATASADWPAVANVRSGVVYDNGNKTGTCAVPTAAQTAYGVPVDNTTGTAVLTAAGVTAAVWDAARSGHAGAGTFGATDEWAGSVDEAAIAAAVLAALEGSPITVICINPERSEDSDYDILRNNASNC